MIDNPVGIDFSIKQVQQIFIDELWLDIDTSKKQFNDRVFRNFDKDGNLIPEIYVGDYEYEEVKFDDRLSILSWFDVSDSTNSFDGGQVSQDVGIFFAVNLDDLYPNLTHRAVEESHKDVIKLLDASRITGITTGEAAYGDYYIDNLKRYNMQPWHVFRVNYLMNYIINC